MSSNGGASGIANVKQDFTFRGALMVIGIVCGFIIVLLILRYCCNIAIDLCIMCDPYEARRTTIEFRDKFFPCFKRRLVVPAVATERESSQTQTLDVETLLASLSDQDRQDVLGAVLTGKVSELFSERTNDTFPLCFYFFLTSRFCCIGGQQAGLD